MGNRTFLYIKKDNTYTTLFEGNNTMALFWVMLMTPNDLALLLAKLKEYEELLDTDDSLDDFDSLMVLKREPALALAISRRPYIEQYYPSSVALFDDWILYLTNEPSDDNLLYLELIEYAAFYTSNEEFYNEFLNMLQMIDNKLPISEFENDVPSLTGFEGWHLVKFREMSQAYRNLEDAPPANTHSKVTSSKQSNTSIKDWLLAIIVGLIVASIIMYLMYK